MLDNFTDSAADLFEPFILEGRRVPSASYDNQSAASTAIGTFPSASTLSTSELLVYSSSVRYPTQGLNSGNFTGITYTTGSAPNYSGATGDRWYFRTFRNTNNADSTFTMTITGTNSTWTAFGGALSSNAVKIWIKVPGVTGWRDVYTDTPAGAYNALDDNIGCRTDTPASSLTSFGTATFKIDFKNETVPANNYFVLRVQASSGWAGRLNSITIANA